MCDGISDCYHGDDEWGNGCNNLTYAPSLRCPGGSTFVSHDMLNNGVNDCPQSYDDELEHHSHITNGPGCTSVDLSIVCVHLNSSKLVFDQYVHIFARKRHVTLTNISLPTGSFMKLFNGDSKHQFPGLLVVKILNSNYELSYASLFQAVPSVTTLILVNNSITNIHPRTFQGLINLSYLDLSSNSLVINNNNYDVFSFLGKLRHLDMSYTQVSYMPNQLLSNVSYLMYLNISHSCLSIIGNNAFTNNKYLISLDLSFTRLSMISLALFNNLDSLQFLYIHQISGSYKHYEDIQRFTGIRSVSVLYVVQSELCCIAPRAYCRADIPSKDKFATCSAIIANRAIVYVSFMYALFDFSFNIIAFVWQYHNSKSKCTILYCNLSVADGVMSLYLMLILVANYVTAGNVAYVALQWKNTSWCRSAGTILAISVFASHMATLLIAIDRFICIVMKPFQRYGFSSTQSIAGVCFAWPVAVVIPTLAAVFSTADVTNSACIMIGPSLSLLFSGIYTLVNLLVFLSIAVIYSIITYQIIRGSIVKSSTQKIQVTARLGAIVLTNFVPSITITVLSSFLLAGIYIPSSLEAMLAFILFPLNACLNPMINTISTRQFLSHLVPFFQRHSVRSQKDN